MYTLLTVFFLVAIVISFLCSLWEAVLLSITPSYAQIKVQEGGALLVFPFRDRALVDRHPYHGWRPRRRPR